MILKKKQVMKMKKHSNTPGEFASVVNNELFNFINSDLKDYLVEKQVEMIYKHVYSYKASNYAMSKRRYEQGGLADFKNIEVVPLRKEGACLFINQTEPQEDAYKLEPLSLAEAVEIGAPTWNMGIKQTGAGPGPRPFTQETVNEMSQGDGLYNVFRNYFNKKGIMTRKIN